jgi:hypothetical protein
MTHRERVRRILHYEPVDRVPVVHFGYWGETLQKWAQEGHITPETVKTLGDGNPTDAALAAQLGFDFNWYSVFHPVGGLSPAFESRVLEELPDGTRKVLGGDGVVYLARDGAGSIPAHVDYLLKDRKAWEELYLPKLQWHPDRLLKAGVRVNDRVLPFEKGGREFLRSDERDYHYGLFCGSLYGWIRTWLTNGVNTMFPIEVGTWNASIRPWREQYGKALRGVGGVNKVVFARDRKAVDEEIERLRPLVALGGFIPCPDHRLPPDAEWDNVRYYCDRFRAVFG